MEAFVGIQIGGISFLDEGTEQVLDILQEKGAVNTLILCTHGFSRGVIGRQLPGQPWPDHGKQERDTAIGGSYITVHPEYYRETCLPPFRAPDPEFEGVDILAEVLPAAHRRGMRVYAWIYENPAGKQPEVIPNWTKVSQVDCFGRRHRDPCFWNPNYRHWWLGILEDHLKSYDIDGVQYGSERRGPLVTVLQHGRGRRPPVRRPTPPGVPPGTQASASGSEAALMAGEGVPYCFCPFCRAEGRARGIDPERAAEGYRRLYAFATRVDLGEQPVDGAFVTFWRILLRFPEILAWEQLWHDGFEGLRKELYGAARAIAPDKPIGWHVWHQNSFSPIYRAENVFQEMWRYSGYLKPVVYHNCAGPRFHAYVHHLHRTILADVEPDVAYAFLSDVLHYDEAPLEDLPARGFSGEYVRRETARCVAAVREGGGEVPVYPGIDIDIPTGAGQKKTQPEDVRAGIAGAFAGGASGVILSRKYSEMWLRNLQAAGDTLRELGKA
jgi:hypothetical protein